ncbi:MAG: hypothetical protein A2Y33_06860 [Spirochaetes bacterium GWF1_51_8]|nr:MAG: hypothetical protein A2Y33_06860 [Spirochaetes bacterium GWF1_51_8]
MNGQENKFKIVRFQKGSFPIIENQSTDDYFFIIKQGQVRQFTNKLVIGAQNELILKEGDFFGVISCMAKRPRLHSIEMLEDTLAIMVRREDFNYLIEKNAPIAMKILRYFSKQLRYFNAILTELSLKSYTAEDPIHLFDLGEYYSSLKMQFNHAAYAFIQYVKHNPEGKYVPIAKSKLSKIVASYKDKLRLEPRREENYYYIYQDSQIIFLEHELGNMLYIIQEGEVKITKVEQQQEVLLNILKPGDIFGEMAILENKPRNATAVASGTVKVMAVSRENFPAIVAAHPQIATKIITLLSERIWFIHRHIMNMLIADPETRLYDAFNILILKGRVNIAQGGSYVFDVGFDDMLKFTGLEKNANGSGTLRNILDTDKSFGMKDGKIVCRDLKKLEQKMNIIRRNLEVMNKSKNSLL